MGVTKYLLKVRTMDGKKFVFGQNSKIKLEKKVIRPSCFILKMKNRFCACKYILLSICFLFFCV